MLASISSTTDRTYLYEYTFGTGISLFFFTYLRVAASLSNSFEVISRDMAPYPACGDRNTHSTPSSNVMKTAQLKLPLAGT